MYPRINNLDNEIQLKMNNIVPLFSARSLADSDVVAIEHNSILSLSQAQVTMDK
jgi:hypothetical protein